MTYKHVPNWHSDVKRVCEDIPIVLIGNKVDVKDRKVKPSQIHFHRKIGMSYFDVSAKSNYNFEKPFIYLLSKLLKNVELVQPPLLKIPEVYIDPATLAQHQAELERALLVPVPEDDDEF
eukprot:gene12972-15247_t